MKISFIKMLLRKILMNSLIKLLLIKSLRKIMINNLLMNIKTILLKHIL